jgi:hypothetical protein
MAGRIGVDGDGNAYAGCTAGVADAVFQFDLVEAARVYLDTLAEGRVARWP